MIVSKYAAIYLFLLITLHSVQASHYCDFFPMSGRCMGAYASGGRKRSSSYAENTQSNELDEEEHTEKHLSHFGELTDLQKKKLFKVLLLKLELEDLEGKLFDEKKQYRNSKFQVKKNDMSDPEFYY